MMMQGRQPAAGGGPVVEDSFDRANSTSAVGTADSGQTWAAQTGTWGINSNQAYLVSNGGDQQNTVAIESGESDVAVQATLSTYQNAMGLIVRGADADNYILIDTEGASGGSRVIVYRRSGGGFTSILTTNSVPWVSGDVMRVECSGTSIEVFRNGSSVGSVTEAAHTSNTKHGLRQYASNTSSRFDDFTVEAL